MMLLRARVILITWYALIRIIHLLHFQVQLSLLISSWIAIVEQGFSIW